MTSASKYIIALVAGLSAYIMTCTAAAAQEYKYETGGMAGTAMYLGDANETSLLRGWHPAGGLVYRYNLNFRWALKAGLLMGKVSGDTKNEATVFPDQAQVAFERNFFELGGQIEFNFLPYSDKYSYLNTRKISPYLFTGLGLTLAPGEDTFFGLNLPMGMGVKYKIMHKVNLGVEYAVHRLFGDAFDAPRSGEGFHLNNPYHVQQGMFKNKDWYNTLLFSITWEFGLRDKRCTTD
jgi:opacity protein-like surface antigen